MLNFPISYHLRNPNAGEKTVEFLRELNFFLEALVDKRLFPLNKYKNQEVKTYMQILWLFI